MKRLEQKKNLLKEAPAKGPDGFELQEAKKFLRLPVKAKEKLADNDPIEYSRLVDLAGKVWAQWESWFMNQDKDAEHPFIDGLYIKRWLDSYPAEFWKIIRDTLNIKPKSERKDHFPELRKELGICQ